ARDRRAALLQQSVLRLWRRLRNLRRSCPAAAGTSAGAMQRRILASQASLREAHPSAHRSGADAQGARHDLAHARGPNRDSAAGLAPRTRRAARPRRAERAKHTRRAGRAAWARSATRTKRTKHARPPVNKRACDLGRARADSHFTSLTPVTFSRFL